MKSILKNIFIKRSDSDINKLIKDAEAFPRYTHLQFKFRNLQLSVTDFISVAWQLKEIFVDEELKFLSSKNSPVVIDCGANVGIASLYFHKIFPQAKIIAFEPDPAIFECLKKNLQLNNAQNVEIIQKAVWINNDGVDFGSDSADGGSIYLEGNKKKLSSVRLKDILAKEASVDFLKIDIEGAETEVLIDSKDSLGKVKNIFLEYHSWQHLPQKLDLVLNILTASGFRYYIRSIGNKSINPFLGRKFDNNMDIQLNIHAIRN